jgi:phosphate uptake regulator
METRKIQVTGKSTYVVSLPKKWVNKVNIKNGDSVVLFPLPDNTLLINPHIGEKERPQTKMVIMLNTDDMDEMQRRFVGAYLAGYSVIEFRSQKDIPMAVRQRVRRISQYMIGPQIIDENPTSISFKDMLDASDFSMSKAVKRMHLITLDMLKDSMRLLKDGKGRSEDLHFRDDEVDKLYWMITKQYYRILRDALFADKMHMTSQEAMSYLLIARSVERMADHALKITNNVQELGDGLSQAKELEEMAQRIGVLSDDVLNAFFRARYEQSFELVSRAQEIVNGLERMKHSLLLNATEARVVVPLAYIIDSLERIASYAGDIAEISINHQFVQEYEQALMRSTA